MYFLFLRSRQVWQATPMPYCLRGCASRLHFVRSRPRLRARRLCNIAFHLPLLVCIMILCLNSLSLASERLLVAVTTSTDNSGLLHYLQPQIQADLGFTPEFIVTGSGQALKLGMNRDVDLVWVHDPEAEADFMTAGHGLSHHTVMYNRFFLVGPKADPAQAKTTGGILEAMKRIAASQSIFVSRGDDSGTHRREKSLWRKLDPNHPVLHQAALNWYLEAGSGMGATLNTAIAMNAYTLVDEATWLKSGNQDRLKIIVEQDVLLRNPYGIIVVAGTGRMEATQKAKRFRDWLVSNQGQKTIFAYRIHDKQGFFAP